MTNLIKISIGLIAVAVFVVAFTCVKQIDAGYRGIKTVWGKVIGESLPEGLYFYNAISSEIYAMDCKTRKATVKTNAYTKDVQQSTVQVAVNYNLNPAFAHVMFKEVGQDYEQKILYPKIISVIKDTFGGWEADKLIANRETAIQSIFEKLQAVMAPDHIDVTGVALENIDFSDQYERAIEEKQIATQNAIKAMNKTKQIEEEAKQKVLTAQAEAESMRIRSQAISQNQNLIQYEAVQRWDGKLPVNMYGSAPIPFINALK